MSSPEPAEQQLEAFITGRDAALLSLDEQQLRTFFGQHGVALPTDMELFWATIHKARTGARSLPLEARQQSKQWLAQLGWTGLDDGEVPL